MNQNQECYYFAQRKAEQNRCPCPYSGCRGVISHAHIFVTILNSSCRDFHWVTAGAIAHKWNVPRRCLYLCIQGHGGAMAKVFHVRASPPAFQPPGCACPVCCKVDEDWASHLGEFAGRCHVSVVYCMAAALIRLLSRNLTCLLHPILKHSKQLEPHMCRCMSLELQKKFTLVLQLWCHLSCLDLSLFPVCIFHRATLYLDEKVLLFGRQLFGKAGLGRGHTQIFHYFISLGSNTISLLSEKIFTFGGETI